MHRKTLLRRVHPVKSFVYGSDEIVEDSSQPNGFRVEVRVRARKGRMAICSECGCRAPVHDRQTERRFDFVPLWGVAVFLLYVMRRVRCPRCGVKVEHVPWIRPNSKSPTTIAMEHFPATWAKHLSWQRVSEIFHVSWDRVHSAVKAAVEHGLAHRDPSNVVSIGVDELARAKGHVYATLVYQIDAGVRRLLFVSKDRTEASLTQFCDAMGEAVCSRIRFVCSDMWKPYLNVIRERLSHAVHVLDRFHIMATVSEAIDELRAEEAKRLKAQGCEALKHSRRLFLKRPSRLTKKQDARLRDIVRLDLKTVRAWSLKESLNLVLDLPRREGRRAHARHLVSIGGAIEAGADEARGAEPADASRADPQLVSGQRSDQRGNRRGEEQPGESAMQNGVRLSHLRRDGSRAVSRAWRAPPAETPSQIRLRRPF
jgi:transposase